MSTSETRLWGFTSSGARFDDNTTVKSTATGASISGAKQTSTDLRCSGSNFAAKTYYDSMH